MAIKRNYKSLKKEELKIKKEDFDFALKEVSESSGKEIFVDKVEKEVDKKNLKKVKPKK